MALLRNRLLRDPFLRALVKNSSSLMTGKMIGLVLNFAAVAVAARVLGVDNFGILALIVGYVALVDGLMNFQTWQALIKFGAEAIHSNRLPELRGIVRVTAIMDASTAVAGAAIAILGASLVTRMYNWDEHVLSMAMIYSISIAFHVSGTATGVLRLFDRFGLLGIQLVVVGALRLVGAVLAMWLEWGLWGYVIVWMASDISSNIFLILLARREFRLRVDSSIQTMPFHTLKLRLPSLLAFTMSTNANASLRAGIKHADILIVGAVLGMGGAGAYKVVKQVGHAVAMIADPLYQSIYPELARLWARGKLTDFINLGVRASLSAGSLALLFIWGGFAIIGEDVISLVFGSSYITAYDALIWYLLGSVVAIYAFPLQPVMLSMGKPHATLVIHAVVSAVYMLALFVFLEVFGIVGAGVAFLLYGALWSGAMLTVVGWLFRRINTDGQGSVSDVSANS